MSYYKLIKKYINNCKNDEPIFLEEIRELVNIYYNLNQNDIEEENKDKKEENKNKEKEEKNKNKDKEEKNKNKEKKEEKEEEKEKNKKRINNNVSVVLSKLISKKEIKHFDKGIYLKGEISSDKLILYKYIEDKFGNVKGYISGKPLFFSVGLTKQRPNIISITTNDFKFCYDEKLDIKLQKPKIEVSLDNYKYLQLFDLIENSQNLEIVDNENDILINFIVQNHLSIEKILVYARLANCRVAVDKFIVLDKVMRNRK